MAPFKLTIRNGPKVSREDHESLAEALASLRAHVATIRAEPDLPAVSAIHTYEPAKLVRARLEISTGRMLRSRDAGIDVMGDGGLIPFRGGVRRTPIAAGSNGTPEQAFEAVEACFEETGAKR